MASIWRHPAHLPPHGRDLADAEGSGPWTAAGFLRMTVEMLLQTYGHHHPHFQADAAEAIVSKARSRNLPENVVRMPGAQKANAPVTPHTIPTGKSETKVNRSPQPR
jgi:hypothetical protein